MECWHSWVELYSKLNYQRGEEEYLVFNNGGDIFHKYQLQDRNYAQSVYWIFVRYYSYGLCDPNAINILLVHRIFVVRS